MTAHDVTAGRPANASENPAGKMTAPTPGIGALHVIAGLEAEHGGPSYSVPRLCQSLAVAGARTTLLSVAGVGAPATHFSDGACEQHRYVWDYARVPLLKGLRLSAGFADELERRTPDADVVHNHGLWLMPNVQAAWAAKRAGKPLVVSPRGMLSPEALAFSPLRKRAFWHLLQGPAVRDAACIHATSESEYAEIRKFGLRNPIAVIPNGIDLPTLAETTPAGRVVLSLGRIHPKKGIDRLLRAWASVEGTRPDWRLRIVGPSEEGYGAALASLVSELGLHRVSIEGPLYADKKLAAYREADLLVLPTLNENFGLSVAESLAAGTPVICTVGAPWSGLNAEGCGWWIEHGAEELASALANAMAMPRGALKAMGTKGRAWMERDFSWSRVAREMLAVYGWLIGGGNPPATLRFD
ncbi:MAG TPA: glycosyltransferase [Micropepsaceae bacterium]|nr:glycosyltransferase [Micropepsaceae bacterium]